MPLKIILGADANLQHRARKLLREYGASSIRQSGLFVEGIFSGIADPNSARADLLVDELNVDMKKPCYKSVWLHEVERVR